MNQYLDWRVNFIFYLAIILFYFEFIYTNLLFFILSYRSSYVLLIIIHSIYLIHYSTILIILLFYHSFIHILSYPSQSLPHYISTLNLLYPSISLLFFFYLHLIFFHTISYSISIHPIFIILFSSYSQSIIITLFLVNFYYTNHYNALLSSPMLITFFILITFCLFFSLTSIYIISSINQFYSIIIYYIQILLKFALISSLYFLIIINYYSLVKMIIMVVQIMIYNTVLLYFFNTFCQYQILLNNSQIRNKQFNQK